MKLNEIEIKHFRCFKDYPKLSLAPGITIFIGKNGAGKTNLLDAISKGMTFIFSKAIKSIPNELRKDLDIVFSNFKPMDAPRDFKNNKRNYPIEISYKGQWQGKDSDWSLFQTSGNTPIKSELYKDAYTIAQNNYRDINIYPLFIHFSASYPHKKKSVTKEASEVLKLNELPPRGFGYYDWDDENHSLDVWERSFINTAQKLEREHLEFFKKKDIDKNWDNNNEQLRKLTNSSKQQVINFVNDCIKRFTAPLKYSKNLDNNLSELENYDFMVNELKLDYNTEEDYFIVFKFNNNTTRLFSELPQGYFRLFSIVFEIAYRSFILNRGDEPEGVVFIDEVELHLHPSLAQEVAVRFQKTFPKIQFIMTTHSPLVISNVRTEGGHNKIVKLLSTTEGFKHEQVENIFGSNYTTSLQEIMDSKYRDATIDKLLNSYVSLKSRGNEERAAMFLKKLTDLVGKDNSIIAKEIEKKLKANK